ncbi:jg8020 [Pararge aegeria aegeria]|uniref:Jg8020 protein n=1 Tax=Pararge aegeria aegeria TaxID=348720 RepID=A0A8S4RJ03_9NEOP|nr:jg8020 [Pararge aegeria aegeria]
MRRSVEELELPIQCAKKLKWKWTEHKAQSTDERWWNDVPTQINAALGSPQRGGETRTNESLGAAANKRNRSVDFGTPYKSPCPPVDFNG